MPDPTSKHPAFARGDLLRHARTHQTGVAMSSGLHGHVSVRQAGGGIASWSVRDVEVLRPPASFGPG